MARRMPLPRFIVPMLIACCACGSALRADEKAERGIEFFEKKIRPVLAENCYGCHSAGAKEIKGGLRLDARDAILAGGESGAVFVAGKPDGSLLLEALRYEGLEMPPTKKLAAEVVADFETWIKLGAPLPADRVTVPSTPDESGDAFDLAAARQFWSFQPPRLHEPPHVKQADWPARPIDFFILARLEAAGLAPNEPAERRALVRRLSFDLTGLPPTPEEVEAFVADESPAALERLVDRLLESPHYGERWARLWLDLARYAEDQAHIVGNDKSLTYPNAYRYRDWVIAALNDDVPYDRFIKLQLAADQLAADKVVAGDSPSADADESGAADADDTDGANKNDEDDADLAALGFIGLGPKYYRRNSPEVMADEWEDRVDTVTRGLLGLTVACARCHDHKFDPIPTEDYYALAGVFASSEMYNKPLAGAEASEKNGHAKDPDQALHIVRDAEPRDLNVFIRGDVKNPGSLVERHFLQVLSADAPAALGDDSGSGRLNLAEAIVDRGNPLTARVLVNRVWAQFFGRGLVTTPSNFGALGQRPSHPELLDDLAVRFMQHGWSLKWLMREIALSSTYRQSSRIDAAKQAADPAIELLGRMPRRRLSIEAWRDALLAASGRLERKVGGPSIEPDDPDETRRTLYSRISRLELNRLLALFDFPDPNVHSERRSETITPLQKLFVLNSPFMLRQADAFVERLEREAGDGAAVKIRRAYAVLHGRAPSDAELELGLSFVDVPASDRMSRWSQYAQVLLASNEVLLLD
jgi:hypothetical protein